MDAHAPKKNNALNTIGIITVGVVGSVFVYIAIVGLQALYVSETSPMATVKSFGAQGEVKDSLKAEQIGNITEPRLHPAEPGKTPLYTIGIETAKQLVIRDAASDPSRLIPAIGPSVKPTIAPAFGRPQPLPAAPPPSTEAPAAPADGSGAAGIVPAGSGVNDGPAGAGPGSAPTAPATPTTGEPGTGSGSPAGTVAPASTTPPATGGATPSPAGGSTPPAGGAAPAAGGSR